MKPRFRIVLTLLIPILLCAMPASAETILGFLEGPAYYGNAGTGAIGMTGWALSDSGIRRVIIQVDGVDIGPARYGAVRPGVQDLYPSFVDSEGPGFLYNLDSTAFSNTLHTISAKVITNDGNIAIIGGSQELAFVNTTALLAPFGFIEKPQRNADLIGRCARSSCSSAPDDTFYTPVSGWALDLGVGIDDNTVDWLELMIDGVPYYRTSRDCRFDFSLGLLSQCYGLPRLDVERIFPYALDAPSAGFNFIMDVGYMISCVGLAEGRHDITIRAGDHSNQIANIDSIPVNFFCAENRPNQSIFGKIENPREGRLYGDDITFQGWALAAEGISRVDLYVDGSFIGTATYGVDSRPGVASQFPGFPDSSAPAWRLIYDSNNLANGDRQVEAYAVDNRGNRVSIGERTFNVRNIFN